MKNHKERRVEEPAKILSYFKAEAPILVIVTITGILYNVGMGAGPYFEGQMAQCLYDILQHRAVPLDMVKLALSYVAVLALVQVMRAGKRYSVRIFSAQIGWLMRHTLYHSLVHMDSKELRRENLGNLMTKAVSDVDACSEGMRKFTTEVFDTGVVMVVYLALLLGYDWRLTLLACLVIPVAYAMANWLKKIVSETNSAYKACEAQLNQLTMDRVSHALTYRITGREKNRDTGYEAQLAAYERASARANIFEGSMMPIYDAIAMCGMLIIFYFGSRNVLGTGWVQWDIAGFTTYVACFTKLAVKTSHAAKLFNAVQKAQVSWVRLKPLLQLQVTERESSKLEKARPVTWYWTRSAASTMSLLPYCARFVLLPSPGILWVLPAGWPAARVCWGKSLLGRCPGWGLLP